MSSEDTTAVGYLVAGPDRNGRMEANWDGLVHPSREAGEAALRECQETYHDWFLCALVPVADLAGRVVVDLGVDAVRPPTDALNTPMGANDAGADTVGGYLLALLRLVWKQGEDAIKRPFGNSGWQHEVYDALAKAGIVAGTFDDDGYVDDVDHRAADELIVTAIGSLLGDGNA